MACRKSLVLRCLLFALAAGGVMAQALAQAPQSQKPPANERPAAQQRSGPPAPPAAASATTDPQTLFFEAFEAYRQGRWDEAEAKVRRGLAAQPGNARALLLLGDTLREKKDLRGARLAYLEAASRDAADVGTQARTRLVELPAPQFELPSLPARNAPGARESLRNAVSLVKIPIGKSELETALTLLEGLLDADDNEAARGFLSPVTAAALRPPGEGPQLSFGGVGGDYLDAVRALMRLAAAQQRLADAPAAARTVAQAENVARAIRRVQHDEYEPGLTAVAFTHVATGYRRVGDAGNSSRAWQDALAAAARAEESMQSGVRANMAIALVDAGDLNAAWAMETLVKQRHPRFFVGDSWPDVLRAMAQQEMDAAHYDKAIALIVKGGEPVTMAFSFTGLIEQALARGRPDVAENMAAYVTHAEKKFEALSAIAMYYAARHRKADARRMLTRLQEFSGTTPALMLAPLYLYVGQPDKSAQVFAGDTGSLRDAALTAMARAWLALGDEGRALQTVAVLDESARESARVELATDCAAVDAACALRLMRGVPVYRWGTVLVARAGAGDFDGAAQLLPGIAQGAGTDAESLSFLPGLAEALGSELARMGYCDEALKFSAQARSQASYWIAVGRCQAGSPPVGPRR